MSLAPPNLAGCVDIVVPQWLMKLAHHDTTSHTKLYGNPGPRCLQLLQKPSVTGLFPNDKPDEKKSARPIPRVSCTNYTTREFYWNFVRTGQPVIFTNCWDHDLAWWQNKAKKVSSCATLDIEKRWISQGNVTPPNCDIYKSVCENVVNVIRGNSCNNVAIIETKRLPSALQIPASLIRINLTHQNPYLLLAKEGMIFGTSSHYDSSCEGTFALQYTGYKKWSFYAPWDIDKNIRMHDRFESILRPGDVLSYGPAWFHHTQVLNGHGDSVGAAYFMNDVPYFGIHRDMSLALSPLGFGACTGEGPVKIVPKTGRWFSQSLKWEAILGNSPTNKEEL